MPKLALNESEISPARFVQVACVRVPAVVHGMPDNADPTTTACEHFLQRPSGHVSPRRGGAEDGIFAANGLSRCLLPVQEVLARAHELRPDPHKARLASLATPDHHATSRNPRDQVIALQTRYLRHAQSCFQCKFHEEPLHPRQSCLETSPVNPPAYAPAQPFKLVAIQELPFIQHPRCKNPQVCSPQAASSRSPVPPTGEVRTGHRRDMIRKGALDR